MSCNKLTSSPSTIDADTLKLLKQYLAIINSDTSQDNLLTLYFNAAVSYITKTFDIALGSNDYLCKYDRNYLDNHLNRYSYKVEIETIKPLNSVKYVRLIKNKLHLSSGIPDIGGGTNLIDYKEIPFCIVGDKVLIDYPCICRCGCNYIEIACNAGYSPIPSDILMAVFQMVSSMYEKGECDCASAVKSSGIGKLLNPYISIL